MQYQVADDDFRCGLNGQVERGEFGRVLNPGVDVSLDADEEQHAFNVGILDSHVEEIAALVVDLMRKTRVSGRPERRYTREERRGSSSTCSAAPGSLLMMASAALLFLCVMAQAKGVIP